MPMKRQTTTVKSRKITNKRSHRTRAVRDPIPVHLNHHIFVDGNGKATVMTQTISGGAAPIERLQPGDKVTFTSNDPASEIRYKQYRGDPPEKTQKGSPFGDELPAGHTYNVADGVAQGRMFTVTTACDFDNHFTFECGREVGRRFEPWSGAGGGTPGPEN